MMASFCEQDNELSGSVTGRKSLDKLSDYHLLKNASVPHSYVVRSTRVLNAFPFTSL